MSGEMMTFPSKWEQFLHDYEFEDARRIYTNGSRLIPSFRVKQMMEHYAPSVEQTGWYGVVRWCAEDVIAAAEQNGVTLTEAQAEKWLKRTSAGSRRCSLSTAMKCWPLPARRVLRRCVRYDERIS